MTPEQLYEQLVQRLSTYSTLPLVNQILELLLKLETAPGHFAYWHAFTLLRWAILYSSSSNLIMLRRAHENDVISMVKAIANMEERYLHRELDKGRDQMFIQLSAIANQQFPLQLTVDKYTFARQLVLYDEIVVAKSRINIQFSELTGISITETLHAFTLLHWCLYPEIFELSGERYNGDLSSTFVSTINDILGREKTNAFLQMLTISLVPISSAKTVFNQSSNLKYPLFDIFYHNPLTVHPILLVNKRCRVVHRSLLNVTFRYFIYDKLKEVFNESFAAEFGRRVEKYVLVGLKEVMANYIDEIALRKLVPRDSKVVDFIVDDMTLIECKGIELHPVPRVKPTPENMSIYLKGSIVKALKQQVIDVITNRNIEREAAIVVIVTYKELNIGFGTDLLRAIFSDQNELAEVNKVINPDRVFILDLEEWDILLRHVKHQTISISDVLNKVVLENLKTPKKLVSMHLEHLFGDTSDKSQLSYLQTVYEDLMTKLQDQFKNMLP